MEDINKEFDEEIEELRKQGEDIPKKGTKEYDEFDAALAQIGTEYRGVTSYQEAYKIYRALGGKKEEEKGEEKTEEKGSVVSEEQRRIAAKVSKGGGGAKGTEPLPYNRLRKSMDELMDDAMATIE